MERLTFAVSNGKVEGRTLSGVAHVYGQVTTDGRNHSFAAGAFAKSIAGGKIVSHAFHDLSKPLASQANGSLRLADGPELSFELDLPQGVSYADDLRALAASGVDLSMSFQWLPSASKRVKGGGTMFTDGRLVSVDPVAMPAFEGTSVILNSAQEAEPAYSQVIKLRARKLIATL